jgi:NAD(P)-dependent dehydrogenase (short-subunit alcohol dehydrogenase family)
VSTNSLDGKVAVVTGGARGIGAAIVRRLADAGARVAVLDLLPMEEQFDGRPVELHVTCDVTDEDMVVAAIGQVVTTMGPPTVGVLNAGIGGFSTILKMTLEEWDRVMGVNIRGVFLCLRELGRCMVRAGDGGAIVVTSSTSSSTSERGMAHYDASKAAVNQLVRVAAREWGPARVRVNAVAPGTTDTPLFSSTAALPGYAERVVERTPLGRVGRPEDIADAVMALVGLEWVTGQVLTADGGLALFSPTDPFDGT